MNPMFFPRNFLAPNCHSQPIGVRKEKLCGKNENSGLKFINSQQLHIGTKIGGADIIQKQSWFEIFLTNNPGLFNLLVTSLLLPLGLLWLNNRSATKIKELEKQLEEKYQGKEQIKTQERAVYSSLSKILFDVQLLHVALSGSCIDKKCIESAVSKFDVSITKYHEEISNNLLYMPSKIIDRIYKFYSKISDLKVSLKEFNDAKNFEMAYVSVYSYSIALADILINIQELLLEQNETLKKNFDKAQQDMMRYCCGRQPPKAVLKKYIELLKQMKPNTSEDEIELMQQFLH